MNTLILNTEIQDFIDENLNSDISKLVLKGINFDNVTSQEIIEQIEAKLRCQKKLPTWFTTKNIYYPNKLNIEQTSSEKAAEYKASLVRGQSLIDLTGGYGIDSYYFAKQIDAVTHCEINDNLSEIVTHNCKSLNVGNINCLNENGIDALKRINKSFDWIYIDPSRRDDTKKKVFLISDCTPNIKTFQGLFLKYAKHVMIKTSPLLDITATLSDLKYVKEIHAIAINNEVKELLWILERDYDAEIEVKTVNLKKETTQNFSFRLNEETNTDLQYSKPFTYLYEPNSAILKVGAFNSVGHKNNCLKLHKHSHLYTSNNLVDFPGRHFKVEQVITFNKKEFSKLKITKANVTTRNFPISVGDIRKKLKIKDGGDIYLFFTTNVENEKIIIVCSKIQ